MDPLVPVFKTYDWMIDEGSISKMIFLKEEEGFSFGAEVDTDVVMSDDLCISTSTSLICKVETPASVDIVKSRLMRLEISARRLFQKELFIKRIAAFYFPATHFVQLAVSNPWVGHQSMLAMPSEVFHVSVGAPCDSQMRFLRRIQTDVCNTLIQPDDSEWANEHQTFREIMSSPDELFAANSNSSL